MDDLHKLCEKLCREVAQSEHSARSHTLREARRLGDAPPALALRAIAAHAEAIRPRLEALLRRRGQILGSRLGRTADTVLAAFRHAVSGHLSVTHLLDAERGYRAVLLGLRHGVDAFRLLRAVAAREGDLRLAGFCDELLLERLARLERAERSLGWFADRPTLALRSGLHGALPPRPGAARAR
jgi:hypothetical protein